MRGHRMETVREWHDTTSGDWRIEAKTLTQSEVLERIESIGNKIEEWRTRPAPKPVERKAKKRPRQIYYNGRFYFQDDVLNGLSQKHGGAVGEELFLLVYADLHGASMLENARVCNFVFQLYDDFVRGAPLPSFFVEVYLFGKCKLAAV